MTMVHHEVPELRDEQGTPLMRLHPLALAVLLSLPLWAACLGAAWWLWQKLVERLQP